jgi:hypothetical protein
VVIGIGVIPFLRPPAASEGDRNAAVPPATGQSSDAAEDQRQSAVIELNAMDPSPASAALSELESLSEMVDTLESVPFPESQFGVQELPQKVERQNSPDTNP